MGKFLDLATVCDIQTGGTANTNSNIAWSITHAITFWFLRFPFRLQSLSRLLGSQARLLLEWSGFPRELAPTRGLRIHRADPVNMDHKRHE